MCKSWLRKSKLMWKCRVLYRITHAHEDGVSQRYTACQGDGAEISEVSKNILALRLHSETSNLRNAYVV